MPMTITNITKDISNNLAVDKDFTTNYMTSLAYSLRGLKQENITFYTAPIIGFGNEPGAAAQIRALALDRAPVVRMAMDALRCPPGDWPVTNLSGGERQLVALAGVLAVLAGTAWWRRRGIDASGAQPPSA